MELYCGRSGALPSIEPASVEATALVELVDMLSLKKLRAEAAARRKK